MRISVRFTAAVHTLLCIAYFESEYRVTSEFVSGSTGVNAVIIRKILLQLQRAGLVTTAVGVGGSHLAKQPAEITLLDIYHAVSVGDDEQEVFNFHPSPNPACQIGRSIHTVLDPVLQSARNAMETELGKTTLADLIGSVHNS